MKKALSHVKSNPKAKSYRRLRSEVPFFAECRKALRNLPDSSDLSQSRKELYQGLVVGTASDLLEERLHWLLDEIRSPWNWAPGLNFLNNSEFLLTWRLTRNELPLAGWAFRVGLADMPDCACCGRGQEETALHALYYGKRVHPFWSHVREWTAPS